MSDLVELVPTLYEVGRQPGIAMAAKKTYRSLPLLFLFVIRMSVDTGQYWRELQRVGRDRKCLVSVQISPISHTVPDLLLLPVYRRPLLFLDVGRMSVDIGQCW